MAAFVTLVWLAGPLLALLAVWPDRDMRLVAYALVASWAFSNAAHYLLDVTEHPQAYTVAEAIVSSIAFLAYMLGGPRLLTAVVSVSLVSVGTNFYISSYDTVTHAQRNLWELATNVLFGLECLLVVVMGVMARLASPRSGARHADDALAFHDSAAGPSAARR